VGSMHLTEVTLAKDDCILILQGMIHVAPAEIYEMLQVHMDVRVGEGYTVFYEGVKLNGTEFKPENERQKKIDEFFSLLFQLFPIFAKSIGFKLQKSEIKYPANSINADIPYEEIVKNLDQIGFGTWLASKIFKLAIEHQKDIEPGINEAINDFLKKDNDSRPDGLIFKLLFSRNYDKMENVILHQRDAKAVEIIENHFSCNGTKKGFVHYGQAHIRGMVGLLERSGWKKHGYVKEYDLSYWATI
jgi:hypothetical protein